MLENKVGLPETSYGEQIRLLAAMCEDEGLAEQRVEVIMRFHVEPGFGSMTTPGRRRRKTLFLRDRVEAAADALGFDYTLIQDPDSTFWDPVFVFIVAAKTWLLLEFYKALQEH